MGVDRRLLLAVTDAATPPLLLAIARSLAAALEILRSARCSGSFTAKDSETRHARRRWECLHARTHAHTGPPSPPGSQVFSSSASRRCHAAIAPTRLAASQRAPPSLRQNSSGASAVSLRRPDRQRGGDDSTPTGWRAGRTVCRDPGEQLRVEPGGLLRSLLPI